MFRAEACTLAPLALWYLDLCTTALSSQPHGRRRGNSSAPETPPRPRSSARMSSAEAVRARRHRSGDRGRVHHGQRRSRPGIGQNPARQAALHGGLHERVAALRINKVCGSGLKAVMLAAQAVATGDVEVAVAGGMESMSNCPYLLPRVREGLRLGNGQVVDDDQRRLVVRLRGRPHGQARGNGRGVFSRSCRAPTQDAYARREPSQCGAATRRDDSRTKSSPVRVPQKEGRVLWSLATRSIRQDTTAAFSRRSLNPPSRENGKVTAGNAPGGQRRRGRGCRDGRGEGARARYLPHGARRRAVHERLAPKMVLMTPVEAVGKVAEKSAGARGRRPVR